MRQYPIYNTIHGQGKQGSADFGSYDGFEQHVMVGSGSQNSHKLAEINVNTWVDTVGRMHFELTVDMKRVKHGVYEPTTGEYSDVKVEEGILVGAFD